MSLAVVMLVFNRPAMTARVLERVAAYRPSQLLVVADGPRVDHAEDRLRCETTRRLFDTVDWKCRIERNYAQTNLGCRVRVASGLDWAFQLVEEAVVLEDDCLPTPDFFRYCEDLIPFYRDDSRVMMLSGTRFFPRAHVTDRQSSYWFSRYTGIWGWATWRRAWASYDVDMNAWPELKAQRWLRSIIKEWWPRTYWTSIFDRVSKGLINTWDYQWLFAVWRAGGCCVIPASNLVSNIGFTGEATHQHTDPWYADLPTEPLPFPLVHPETVRCSDAYDALLERSCYSRRLSTRIRGKLATLALRRA